MDIEPQLKSLGHQALQDLYNNLVNAKAFALEHAPDVCQQIIAWQITNGIVFLVFAIACVSICVCLWMSFNKVNADTKRRERDEEVPWGVCAVIFSAIALFTAIVATIECMRALKAIVAPKLFLVEYIANIIK